MRSTLWLLVFAPAVALACSSGTNGGGATLSDAGDEAATIDGGPQGGDDGGADGAADGSTQPDATATTWCQGLSPKPAFCDDFDRGLVGASWDSVVQVTGSAIAFDQSVSRSAPQSLAVRSKNLLTADFASVLLRKTITGTPTRAKLSFDLMADAPPQAGGTVAVATLDMSTTHLFTLYLRDDGGGGAPSPALVEQPPVGASVRHPFTAPALSQWVRVELDVDLTAHKVSLRFDGVAALDQLAIATSTADGPTVRLGALVFGPLAPFNARFDNVTLEFP